MLPVLFVNVTVSPTLTVSCAGEKQKYAHDALVTMPTTGPDVARAPRPGAVLAGASGVVAGGLVVVGAGAFVLVGAGPVVELDVAAARVVVVSPTAAVAGADIPTVRARPIAAETMIRRIMVPRSVSAGLRPWPMNCSEANCAA